MIRPHLRQQAGGHPSEGPVREMANPEKGPDVGNDFPDGPDASGADGGDANPPSDHDD